jgi:hypothetical protein
VGWPTVAFLILCIFQHLEYVVGDIREAAQKEENLQAQQERRRPEKVSVAVDLILVLLPSKADEIRTSVKHWGDVKVFPRPSSMNIAHPETAWDPYLMSEGG